LLAETKTHFRGMEGVSYTVIDTWVGEYSHSKGKLQNNS